MKLEHHFANEGKDESIVITIPKGQYLPIFQSRLEKPLEQPVITDPAERKTVRSRWVLTTLGVLFGLVAIWLGYLLIKSRSNPSSSAATAAPTSDAGQNQTTMQPIDHPGALPASANDLSIDAGHTGAAFVDAFGRRWEADRYFEGGVVEPGPRHFFPPVPDDAPFRTIREAISADSMVPQSERGFQYNIPLSPGAYELRLYFADPLRNPDADEKNDAQNDRQFQVNLNRHPLLTNFDPIADAGSAAVDVRVFKDVYPDSDGKLHLEFVSNWGKAFLSGIEITPGVPGKLKPIRIAAGRQSDFEDANGVRWSADNYYIDGRTWAYQNPPNGPKLAPLYVNERHGNFSYSIPVAPGSYTVRLHFLEAFFSPVIPAAYCHGVGCRVFDVSCNGQMLLPNFDINKVADGPLKPVIREFHGLHPNGQGKLLISFSPRVNYAEVRAIEVIDEAK